MKQVLDVCARHGILPNSYILLSDQQYYFILGHAGNLLVAIRSYSKKRPILQHSISTRLIDGEEYYRLLDVPQLRIPLSIDARNINIYYCPICTYYNDEWCDSKIRKIIDDLAVQVDCSEIGISGGTLIRSAGTHDFDLVFFGVKDLAKAAHAIENFKNRHQVETISWRRFRYAGKTFCLYLKSHHPIFDPCDISWDLVGIKQSTPISLYVIHSIEGYASPSVYECLRKLNDGQKVQLANVFFFSIQPGHAGLLRDGDEFDVSAIEMTKNGYPLILSDPRNPWIELKQ